MVSTVNLELPAVDACGMKTVKNPLGDITLLATDVKTRAHRLGLRRQQQVKCPVTGMVLEPNGNATRLNLDKKPQAFSAIEEGVRAVGARPRDSERAQDQPLHRKDEREARPDRTHIRQESLRVISATRAWRRRG